MVKAIWNGEVIAESSKTIEIEGNQYFPADSVHEEFFLPSSTTSVCPWKGAATYFTLSVNGEKNVDAAWTYPSASEKAKQIENYVAFWNGVKILTD